MSEETNQISPPEQDLSGLTSLLETLVPPKNISIEDVFGTVYEVSSVVSARNQILIMREFDKIKEIKETIKVNLSSLPDIMDSFIVVSTNEIIFNVLCNCFEIAHKKIVAETRKKASEDENHVGDLFAIEEIVGGIIPLFIRLARKTGQAIQALS
tara:strand:+ start:114 stop:578 length:465 start_codon:yes stop_codon:yes gene_type:complete